jgi:hypothetical protein
MKIATKKTQGNCMENTTRPSRQRCGRDRDGGGHDDGKTRQFAFYSIHKQGSISKLPPQQINKIKQYSYLIQMKTGTKLRKEMYGKSRRVLFANTGDWKDNYGFLLFDRFLFKNYA